MPWRPTMPSVAPIPPTLTTNLRRIGLLRLADDLNDVIARATKSRWGPVALLEALVAAEIDDRARRSLERRLAHARLGRFKSLADREWDWPKGLNRPVLERVLTLDFLAAPKTPCSWARKVVRDLFTHQVQRQVIERSQRRSLRRIPSPSRATACHAGWPKPYTASSAAATAAALRLSNPSGLQYTSASRSHIANSSSVSPSAIPNTTAIRRCHVGSRVASATNPVSINSRMPQNKWCTCKPEAVTT